MSTYNISTELSGILAAELGIQENVFRRVSQAIGILAEETANEWKTAVSEAKLWSGERDKYRDAISWKMTGDFEAIVQSAYKWDEEIEKGRPPRDLKKMLSTSLKTRTSKKGNRYLYIPFWHKLAKLQEDFKGDHAALRAIASMEMTRRRRFLSIPKEAKGFVALRNGKLMIPSPTGRPGLVLGRKSETGFSQYKWGTRLGGFTGKNAKYNGLIRADTSSGKQRRSERLTIRTMSDKSTGWVTRPQPGLWIVKGIADRLQAKLDKAVGAAIEIDSSGN